MIIRRIGLVLAGVIALLALVPALEIRPEVDTGQVGVLSVVVLVVTAAVAVVTIAFMVPAWLGGRAASITIAVAQLAGILTSLPAFFAPAELVSTGAVASAAVGAVLQVAVFAMIVLDVSTVLLHTAAVIVIVAVYAVGVSLATALLPPSADRLVQTSAAIVVALLFQPVLSLLRRIVGRALYGGRLDPGAATLRIGQHRGDETAAVAAAVEEAARALRLPGIQIRDCVRVVASSSSPELPYASVVDLPLTSDSALMFRIALRPGERRLHRDDRSALHLIAVPLGSLIRETELLTELRVARAALADTREREQQALHRELHEGIGPLLTGAVMRADAARNLLDTDPESARKQLDAARANLRIAVVDLRRVVYGMWPLELEQHGLWGAIAAGAIRSGAVLALPAEPPQLSPATELACYRIISEALTNIDRHAPGTLPTIAIRTDGDTIHLSVSNAGPTPDGFVAGIGITSIHDRVDELGGRAWVGPHLDGWLVEAILPLTPG